MDRSLTLKILAKHAGHRLPDLLVSASSDLNRPGSDGDSIP